MTWSVNWDAAHDYQFSKQIGINAANKVGGGAGVGGGNGGSGSLRSFRKDANVQALIFICIVVPFVIHQ